MLKSSAATVVMTETAARTVVKRSILKVSLQVVDCSLKLHNHPFCQDVHVI